MKASDSKAEGFMSFSLKLLLWNQALFVGGNRGQIPFGSGRAGKKKRRGRLQDELASLARSMRSPSKCYFLILRA